MLYLKEKLLTELDRFLESVARANKNRAIAEPIKNIEKACQLYFKKQGELFLRQFEIFRNRFSESISDEEIRRILQQIQPYIEKGLKVELITNLDIVMAKAVRHSFDSFGFAEMDISFALANPRAIGFLERHAAELVTNIDETTRSMIAKIVRKGVEEGYSYNKVAEQISSRFTQFRVGKPQLHIESRAHLVAVTENRMAYEAGNMEAGQFMKRQGLSMEKYWMNSGDDRVSDGCLENSAAGWIDIDEAFPSGDDTSPRFPGCRCDILYRRKGASYE
jgi:hypothetical protein